VLTSFTVEGVMELSLKLSEKKGMGGGGPEGNSFMTEGGIVSLGPSEKGMGGGGTNSLSGELMAGWTRVEGNGRKDRTSLLG
jgi:hypothetical protein